ncbi:MAG: flagellar export protein FliJ [Nitrospirae bacterium]|nr:flagellar export protein FliJ [Nitrospirota bacterium]
MMIKTKIKKALELKEYRKEQFKISVQKSRNELEGEYAKLEFIINNYEQIIGEFNKKHKEGLINVKDLDFFYNYIFYLSKQIEQQKKNVSLKFEEVELKQKGLINAHMEKRVFEMLYNKICSEEDRKKTKGEQKEADLLFLSKKNRR